LFRAGKAAISREVAAIFDRIGTTAATWQARLETLSKGRLLGRFFEFSAHSAIGADSLVSWAIETDPRGRDPSSVAPQPTICLSWRPARVDLGIEPDR